MNPRFRLYAAILVALSNVLFASLLLGKTREQALNQVDQNKIESIKKQLTTDPLSDDQVQTAIMMGLTDKNKAANDIGLSLEDSTQKWANALTSRSEHIQHSGFSVRVFTPSSWISLKAHEAKRKYKPYTVADVTESDRLQVLRIVVNPDTPEAVVASRGMRDSSSVEHVVLRSEDKGDAVQPLTVDPYQVDVQNAMGAKLAYAGVVAIFRISDMDIVRRASEKREFLVTVIGDGGKERDFKVKEKHFSRLN